MSRLWELHVSENRTLVPEYRPQQESRISDIASEILNLHPSQRFSIWEFDRLYSDYANNQLTDEEKKLYWIRIKVVCVAKILRKKYQEFKNAQPKWSGKKFDIHQQTTSAVSWLFIRIAPDQQKEFFSLVAEEFHMRTDFKNFIYEASQEVGRAVKDEVTELTQRALNTYEHIVLHCIHNAYKMLEKDPALFMADDPNAGVDQLGRPLKVFSEKLFMTYIKGSVEVYMTRFSDILISRKIFARTSLKQASRQTIKSFVKSMPKVTSVETLVARFRSSDHRLPNTDRVALYSDASLYHLHDAEENLGLDLAHPNDPIKVGDSTYEPGEITYE